MNDYQKAIDILTSSTKFHIKLGLERTQAFLELLNSPQEKYKIIHIAGTNGKGSTSAMLAEILKNAGYKVGLFTSPHIIEYTERIKINGVEISQEEFAKTILETCDLADKNGFELTEFETLTCAAFYYFAKQNVDIVVLEVGLGGRLDSTNVIKQNLCSVITSISKDHTAQLGDTIEQIAFEKAGIIKPNCPVIFSQNNAGLAVVKDIAVQKGANVVIADDDVKIFFENNKNFTIINGKKYEFSLLGKYQEENLKLVVAVVEQLRKIGIKISEAIFAKSLQTVKWKARFEFLPDKNILIDAAHNPGGAKVLRESLDYYFPNQKRIWIYGSLTTKDFSKNMEILFNPEDKVYFYHFNYPKSATFEKLQSASKVKGKELTKTQIKNIISQREKNELLIICGSFYMLDEVCSFYK